MAITPPEHPSDPWSPVEPTPGPESSITPETHTPGLLSRFAGRLSVKTHVITEKISDIIVNPALDKLAERHAKRHDKAADRIRRLERNKKELVTESRRSTRRAIVDAERGPLAAAMPLGDKLEPGKIQKEYDAYASYMKKIGSNAKNRMQNRGVVNDLARHGNPASGLNPADRLQWGGKAPARQSAVTRKQRKERVKDNETAARVVSNLHVAINQAEGILPGISRLSDEEQDKLIDNIEEKGRKKLVKRTVEEMRKARKDTANIKRELLEREKGIKSLKIGNLSIRRNKGKKFDKKIDKVRERRDKHLDKAVKIRQKRQGTTP